MAEADAQLDQAIHFAMAEVKRLGDMEKLAAPVRTVFLVQIAQGIIDNGGLQYFFEADFPHKPPYSVFVDAYRAIGAEAAAQALASAVLLFPFSEPHLDVKGRDAFLEKFLDGGWHRPDSPFEPYTDVLCGNKEVWRLLSLYVSEHASDFSRKDNDR